MKISDTMEFFGQLSSEEQLALIRNIRARRAFEKPASTRRKAVASYKPKRQEGLAALRKLSPDQLKELLTSLVEEDKDGS